MSTKAVRVFRSKVTVLRLAYHGCVNRPFFHIVATMRSKARNKGHYEQVGTFDPMKNEHGEKLVALNMDRIKYWIGNGAEVTKPVGKLLGLAGVFPIHQNSIAEAAMNREKIANEAAAEMNREKIVTPDDEPVNRENSKKRSGRRGRWGDKTKKSKRAEKKEEEEEARKMFHAGPKDWLGTK